MNNTTDIGTTSKSKTYKHWTPCGNLYTTFIYKDDGKIDYVLINGNGKNNACGNSFVTSIADFLTFSIRRIRNKYEAEAIVKNLLNHRCNKVLANKDHITSCIDSVGKILKRELDV